MDKTYKVWLVYEPGRFWMVRWYVVNSKTHRLHSAWEDYGVATTLCRDLNAMVKFGKIA